MPEPSEETGIGEIYQERKRQIEAEGFTYAHDDTHENGELLAAAVLYRQFALGEPVALAPDGAPIGWPFEPSWWKTEGGPRRALVKAGALAIAERQRLHRQYPPRPVGRVNMEIALIASALKDMEGASS